MLVFRDESIYKKCKYTIILRDLGVDEGMHRVEIEYLDPCNSCWHYNLPFEDELKDIKDAGGSVEFWAPYGKWQKRKKYTPEEFNRIFTNQ